jgi:hypothetical protein
METVRPDDQIERARLSALEGDLDAARILINSGDAIVENRLNLIFDRAVNGLGKLAARNAEESLPERSRKKIAADSASLAAVRRDELNAIDEITRGAECGDEAHSLRDVEAGAPEVDHVAAFPKSRRTFDQNRFESTIQQPVSERGTRDARTRNQDRLPGHGDGTAGTFRILPSESDSQFYPSTSRRAGRKKRCTLYRVISRKWTGRIRAEGPRDDRPLGVESGIGELSSGVVVFVKQIIHLNRELEVPGQVIVCLEICNGITR